MEVATSCCGEASPQQGQKRSLRCWEDGWSSSGFYFAFMSYFSKVLVCQNQIPIKYIQVCGNRIKCETVEGNS